MTTNMGLILDLEAMLYGQGYAERTVKEYVKWANRLARWCDLHDLDLRTVGPDQVRRWIDETVPPGRESRKQAFSATRHLFTMLARTDQPWLAIRVPHKRRGNPRPLTEDERVRLRDAAILVGGRPGLATLGLLTTAARPSEVAQWRWDGIDLEQRKIRFWRSKTRDWHEVPIRPVLADALERARPAWVEGFVFAGRDEHPHVCPYTINLWVKQVAELAEVKDCNPRRLRATAISKVLEATGQIDVAGKLAGHQDLSVTHNYYAATSWRRLEEGSAALD